MSAPDDGCSLESWGWTDLSSYWTAGLDFEKEQCVVAAPAPEASAMSRRSLRLHTTAATGHYGNDPSLGGSLGYSASYSAGGASRRDVARVLKSRRAQPLLSTPRNSTQSQGPDSSLHSCASDASLLSSMLDESCIQERTMVDSLWGLDEDAELNESTMLEETIILPNGGNSSAQTQTSMMNGYFCTDFTVPSDKKEAPAAYPSSSSKYIASSSSSAAALSHLGPRDHPLTAGPAPSASFPASTTVYSRDKSRRHKTGLLASLWILSVCVSRRAVARAVSLLSLLPLLYHNPSLRRTLEEGKGVLNAVCTRLLPSGRAAAAAAVSALTSASQAAASAATAALRAVLRGRSPGAQKEHNDDDDDGTVVDRAHSSFCGSMNVKELATDERGLNQNGSLCDDCKGEQRLDAKADPSPSSSSWSSRFRRPLGALWSVGAYAGSSLLWIGQKVGVASWVVSRQLLSTLWLAVLSPGKAAATVFWCLGRGWYQVVSVVSLLNVFVMTRCLPKLLRLLLLLLPFLLILGLWSWGPSILLSVLPSVNTTVWGTASPLTPSSSAPEPIQSPAEEDGQAAPAFAGPPSAESLEDAGTSLHAERLARLEQSLSRLWERVEGDGGRLEQQQREEAALYRALQEQLHARTHAASLEPWVTGLLEDRLAGLRREMEDEEARREESRQRYVTQQEDQDSRLAQLELLLQDLVLQTEEVQRRQESFTPAPATTLLPPSAPLPVSVGVDRESHDALLAEVRRLEAVLDSVRQDLHGVMGCQGRCEVLDTFQDTVSAQVRRELRSLFYGNLQTPSGDPAHQGSEEAELPEALLPWLSERYASGADLQAALADLEIRILQNVSLLLRQQQEEEEHGAKMAPSTETLAQAVMQTAGPAGVTEEHVELIVRNALKLYSQDRTGLVDYALESGGGSILSTRCSETHETKTALMSLFGLPLWYFSQSPRVVIQPDVHPGNCWAFKGSSGYLVIRLSTKIRPTAFSLEHIPKALSPTGHISSAPRQFAVYGLDDENQEEGKLLGAFTYEEDGDALQTYSVTEENDQDYQVIDVRVLSNWGHQEYTCLYRFRVHGEPSHN